MSDIAILGPPDYQEVSDRWEQYNELVDSLDPISVADAPEDTPAWLLSLDKQWRRGPWRPSGRVRLWKNRFDTETVRHFEQMRLNQQQLMLQTRCLIGLWNRSRYMRQ